LKLDKKESRERRSGEGEVKIGKRSARLLSADERPNHESEEGSNMAKEDSISVEVDAETEAAVRRY
jgi:hypothetical protein